MTEPKPKTPNQGRATKGNALALTHGGFSFLRTGRLPTIRGRRRIQRELLELKRRLDEATPGSDDPRRGILISQIIHTEGFILLVEQYLRLAGLLRATKGGRLEVQPALQTVISLMTQQLRAVQALGLDRKQAEAVLTPYEILEKEKDNEQHH